MKYDDKFKDTILFFTINKKRGKFGIFSETKK